MVNGLTTANLGLPDYEKALVQHAAYVQALKTCGLYVTVLPPDNNYPDSTFVEDTALVTSACAIIMRPGATSRRGETEEIETVLRGFYSTIERVRTPGTVDAGDIMMVGKHFYIGLSQRTNAVGAGQVIQILNKHGMTASTVPLKEALHLKSGTAYIENGYMVTVGEFIGPESSRAAEAAYCAGDQDKFWEYHDYVLRNQRGENAGWFSDRRLTAFAEALTLDINQFNTCFNNGKHRDLVNQDLVAARDLGITSTPTFIISYQANGQTVSDTIKGAEAFTVFQQKLDAALTAAGG